MGQDFKGELSKIWQKVPSETVQPDVARTSLENPKIFLDWVQNIKGKKIDIDQFEVLQPWCICAIAAMSRSLGTNPAIPELAPSSDAGRFAYSLGLKEIIQNDSTYYSGHQGRTIKLTRLKEYAKIDEVARELSGMVIDTFSGEKEKFVFEPTEVKNTIEYVLIELLRNVIQHSGDPLGAMFIAQRMDKGFEYSENPCIQVAVCDEGIGIYESISAMHQELESPKVALERALWPSISGKFAMGEGGTAQNAGMGLFFVSEMAKRAGGRLLIASRGAAILIDGRDDDKAKHRIQFVESEFKGTLVVFEMPKRGIVDYDELIKNVRETAYERMPKKNKVDWFKYDGFPPEINEYVIKVASENTVEAEEYSTKFLMPKIEKGEAFILNFANMQICTQSFLHALLFRVLRLAFERNVTIYIKNVRPAIKDCLLLLEWYAL